MSTGQPTITGLQFTPKYIYINIQVGPCKNFVRNCTNRDVRTASSLWLGYLTELTVGVKSLPLAGWD